MPKYIDAEMVLSDLVADMEAHPDSNFGFGLQDAIETIRMCPAADVQEVKHGKWNSVSVSNYFYGFYCSNCHKSGNVPTVMGEPMYSYCPWCGAKMDGEQDE